MLTDGITEKYVTLDDIICIADLALRWPFQAVLKIPHHATHPFTKQQLISYIFDNNEYHSGNNILYKLTKAPLNDHNLLFTKSVLIVFLRLQVEVIESEYPEYKLCSQDDHNMFDIFISKEETLRDIIPRILFACCIDPDRSMSTVLGEWFSPERASSNRITAILSRRMYNYTLSDEQIRPSILQNHIAQKELTPFDRAKIFVEACRTLSKSVHSGNKQSLSRVHLDNVLIFIELDTRFPELKNYEVVELVKGPVFTEKDSKERAYYRLKEDAYRYQKIPIA